MSNWEDHKENVKPTTYGRRIETVTKSLELAHSKERQDELQNERKHFEQTIKEWTDKDLLKPWLKYIKWTRDEFPMGGKDSKMLELLERVIAEFSSNPQIMNDSRFVKLWLDYVNMVPNADERHLMYQYMYSKKIGIQSSNFWWSWALLNENIESFEKAGKIYESGLKRLIDEREFLKKRQREFLKRKARFDETSKEKQSFHDDGTRKRVALASVNADSAMNSHRITFESRSGLAGLASKASSRGRTQSRTTVHNNKKIDVFVDDENSSSELPETKASWNALPSREERIKENTVPTSQFDIGEHDESSGHGIAGAQKMFPKRTIPVFVDDDCVDKPPEAPKRMSPGNRVLRSLDYEESNPSKLKDLLEDFQKRKNGRSGSSSSSSRQQVRQATSTTSSRSKTSAQPSVIPGSSISSNMVEFDYIPYNPVMFIRGQQKLSPEELRAEWWCRMNHYCPPVSDNKHQKASLGRPKKRGLAIKPALQTTTDQEDNTSSTFISSNKSSITNSQPSFQIFGASDDKKESKSSSFGIFEDKPSAVNKAKTTKPLGFGIFEDDSSTKKQVKSRNSIPIFEDIGFGTQQQPTTQRVTSFNNAFSGFAGSAPKTPPKKTNSTSFAIFED